MYFRLKERGPYGCDKIFRRVEEVYFLGQRRWTCGAIAKNGQPSIELIDPDDAEIEGVTTEEWEERRAIGLQYQAAEEAGRRLRLDIEAHGIPAGPNHWIVKVSPTRYTDNRGTKWERREETIGGERQRGTAWMVGRVPGFTRAYLESEVVEAVEAACGGVPSYDFVKAGKKAAARTGAKC